MNRYPVETQTKLNRTEGAVPRSIQAEFSREAELNLSAEGSLAKLNIDPVGRMTKLSKWEEVASGRRQVELN